MQPFNMNPMMPGFPQEGEGTNLLSILINLAFGFVGGLMIFFGPKEIISYGSKLAGDIIALTGYGQQLAVFGFAATAAPYLVLAPIMGMVLKQLSSVSSIKSFAFFALAVAIGIAGAYVGQEYVASLISS